jgi:hypothetical protein
MKRQTVVKAFIRELFKIGDRLGRLIVVQFEADIAMLGFDSGGFHGGQLSVGYEMVYVAH